jgi:L-iditol 2-dehydrogenase
MKALLLKQYMQLELTDMPTPTIRANEVLVRVKACGICGSDVHGIDGSTGRRIPPLVMGHEAAGIVAGVGSEVTHLREGDRVTFDSTIYCGHCFFCRQGWPNLCDNRLVLGVSCEDYRQHGAFAEYVAVPQHIVYTLPDVLSFDHAALIEALSIAVHAVGLTPIRLDSTAVVVGSGMIGLLVIQSLRLAGCMRVFAVDIDDAKLKMAVKLGAEEGLDPKTCDVPSCLRERTGGRGADISFEVVGATESLSTALASVRKGGALIQVGNFSPKVELPLQSVVAREIKVLGSCSSAGEYPACIDLLARGAIQVEPFISARVPLTEGVEWFDRLYRKEPNLMKVILQP